MNESAIIAHAQAIIALSQNNGNLPPPIQTDPGQPAQPAQPSGPSGDAIEMPFRSGSERIPAPGGPACFWFRTPATPSEHGAVGISIVANHSAASKLVLSLTPNDFDHPLGDLMGQAVSYGDSGETRSMSFYVGKTVMGMPTLPLDTIIYANFKYTGELDGGPIQAYLANAQ